MEGVDDDKVGHKAGLDLANEWIPLRRSSRVGGDHFSKFVVCEVVIHDFLIPQVCHLQFVKARL